MLSSCIQWIMSSLWCPLPLMATKTSSFYHLYQIHLVLSCKIIRLISIPHIWHTRTYWGTVLIMRSLYWIYQWHYMIVVNHCLFSINVDLLFITHCCSDRVLLCYTRLDSSDLHWTARFIHTLHPTSLICTSFCASDCSAPTCNEMQCSSSHSLKANSV